MCIRDRNEAEYKEQKIQEHVVQMREELKQTKQEIGDLHAEKKELEDRTRQATKTKEHYEQKMCIRDRPKSSQREYKKFS